MVSFGVNTKKHIGFYGLYKMQHFRIAKYLCGTVTSLNNKGKTFQKGQDGKNKSPAKEKAEGFGNTRDKNPLSFTFSSFLVKILCMTL